jgi:hypothetical protein
MVVLRELLQLPVNQERIAQSGEYPLSAAASQ